MEITTLTNVMAHTKDGYWIQLSLETMRRRNVGRRVTEGEKDIGISTTTGIRVVAKGPRGSDGSRVTDVVRTALTSVLGSPPVTMPPAIYSGLINFEWDGDTNLDEESILEKLVQNVRELEVDWMADEKPQVHVPPLGERVWFCDHCLEGPWREQRAADAHINLHPTHRIRHTGIGVWEREKQDRERSIKMYWVCSTCFKGPWTQSDWAEAHRKLNQGHEIKVLGKNELGEWDKGRKSAG